MANDVDQARLTLAYLRELVEDSRPLLRPMGQMLAIAGAVHAISALRFLAIDLQWIDWPAALQSLLGIDAVAMQIAITIALVRRPPPINHLGDGGPAGRAIRAAVSALGWAVGTAVLALAIATRRSGQPELLAIGVPLVLFALASATWQVIFVTYRHNFARAAAVASAASAIAVGIAAGETWASIVVAIGLVSSLALPGLAMARAGSTE